MPEQSNLAKSTRLQLDLRIPVALIISLAVGFLAQTAAMYRWVGGIEQRVMQLEENEERAVDQGATLVRLEERLNNAVSLLLRFEARIDAFLAEKERN